MHTPHIYCTSHKNMGKLTENVPWCMVLPNTFTPMVYEVYNVNSV